MILSRSTQALLAVSLLGTACTADDGDAFPVKRVAPGIASIQGLVQVDGEDAVVELLIKVEAGDDIESKARDVLSASYPHARPLGQFRYATTGLVWDQFLDSDPGNDTVDFKYNDANEPAATNLRAALDTAAATWGAVSGSNFAFTDTGDTNRCPSLVKECKGRQKFDGNNDVGWIKINDLNVLGVTWYGTSTDEFDIGFDNEGWDWYTGDPAGILAGQIDVETVYLHELGHGLGLGHPEGDVEQGHTCPNYTGAVMDACLYSGTTIRSLAADDEDGVRYLYPAPEPPAPCTSDAECDDQDPCNGAETCDLASGDCQAGTPLSCDDGVFCNGAETCDPGSGCQSGTPITCDDGDACTQDSCIEGPPASCEQTEIPGCAPACAPAGSACTSGSECCSGSCPRGGPNRHKCK